MALKSANLQGKKKLSEREKRKEVRAKDYSIHYSICSCSHKFTFLSWYIQFLKRDFIRLNNLLKEQRLQLVIHVLKLSFPNCTGKYLLLFTLLPLGIFKTFIHLQVSCTVNIFCGVITVVNSCKSEYYLQIKGEKEPEIAPLICSHLQNAK